METREAIQKRQSIRKFTDKKIDESTLKEIIEDANRTASWANSQPWKVYIATGDKLAEIRKEQLRRDNRGMTGNADFSTMHRDEWDYDSQMNMAEWGSDLQSFLGNRMIDYSKSQDDLFNANALVYLTIPMNSSEWSVYDLGAYSQTLMLSATDHGLGSMPAYEIIKYPDMIREQMDIPETQMISMGVALGYVDDSSKVNNFRTDRVGVDDMLTIEK
jgi:nitroreductase